MDAVTVFQMFMVLSLDTLLYCTKIIVLQQFKNDIKLLRSYDSAHSFTVGVNLREAVCSFYKSDAALYTLT